MARRLVAVGAAIAVVGGAAAPAAQAADKLPDIRMARVSEMKLETVNGRRLLKYTATIVNVGVGRFEARGSRSSGQSRMRVTQRIYNTSGGYRSVSLPSTTFMVYAPSDATYGGDGHNHWHLNDLQSGTLSRLDNGVKVGTLAKHGFCVYDNTMFRLSLPGAPGSPYYTGCGTSTSTSVRMGLSIGWGDTYRYTRANQWFDITGLANGRYRLRAVAETPARGFIESDTTNNFTYTDISISNGSISVLRYGPSA